MIDRIFDNTMLGIMISLLATIVLLCIAFPTFFWIALGLCVVSSVFTGKLS